MSSEKTVKFSFVRKNWWILSLIVICIAPFVFVIINHSTFDPNSCEYGIMLDVNMIWVCLPQSEWHQSCIIEHFSNPSLCDTQKPVKDTAMIDEFIKHDLWNWRIYN